MKLYPYQTIQTVNLPTLLFAARALGIFAYIFSFFTVLLWGAAFAVDPRVRETCLLVSIGTFSATICFLVISGLCAAVVSCEQKYTQGQNATQKTKPAGYKHVRSRNFALYFSLRICVPAWDILLTGEDSAIFSCEQKKGA